MSQRLQELRAAFDLECIKEEKPALYETMKFWINESDKTIGDLKNKLNQQRRSYKKLKIKYEEIKNGNSK